MPGTTHSSSSPSIILPPESRPLVLLSSAPGREEQERGAGAGAGAGAGGVACLSPIGQPPNHTSTRPHSIKSLSPDLTRAKAGRPPTRTHANSHFMATPGHQSLSLPCIPYRHHRPQIHSLAAHNGTFLDPPIGAPMGPMDHGPWLVGHGTMCRCHPTTGIHPCASPSLPFPTRSQVESTASHDHLNVSIRPEFRAEEAVVEHWYRAYWKAKRLPA